jgi:hypothetical protein
MHPTPIGQGKNPDPVDRPFTLTDQSGGLAMNGIRSLQGTGVRVH